jgi:hypothetical protein
MTVKDHDALLEVLLHLKCLVMISGYAHVLYDQRLKDWRRLEFLAPSRGNTLETEVVWLNFPPPRELHDYRFLGRTFREREVIRRRIQRWKKRFSKMNELESFAMFAALDEVRSVNARVGNGRRPESPELAMVDQRAQSPEPSMLQEES